MFFYSLERQVKATVKEAANLFKNSCYEKRDEASAGIICAGWDEREGGQVYVYIDHYSSSLHYGEKGGK